MNIPLGARKMPFLSDDGRRVIVPADAAWDDFFATPGADLPDRDKPDVQRRADF